MPASPTLVPDVQRILADWSTFRCKNMEARCKSAEILGRSQDLICQTYDLLEDVDRMLDMRQ